MAHVALQPAIQFAEVGACSCQMNLDEMSLEKNVEGSVCARSLNKAMESLKAVLQSMDAPQRQAAIQRMAPDLRVRLLAFMEENARGSVQRPRLRSRLARTCDEAIVRNRVPARRRKLAVDGTCVGIGAPSHACEAPVPPGRIPHSVMVPMPLRRDEGLWIVRGGRNLRYRARIYFNSLCVCAKGHFQREVVLEHCAILSHLRRVVFVASACDAHLWDDDGGRVLACCRAALAESGTSEEVLGLRAFVSLRATQYLGTKVIVTPAASLADALAMRARLVAARSASWDVLRAAWIKSMQHGGPGRRTLPTKARVADAVDQARRCALQQQLLQVVGRAERALVRIAGKVMSNLGSRVDQKAALPEDDRVTCKRQRLLGGS